MNRQDVPPIEAGALQKLLQEEFDACIKEITEAVNTARPGAIISDSEEPVRIATAKLRQKIFELVLGLRRRCARF